MLGVLCECWGLSSGPHTRAGNIFPTPVIGKVHWLINRSFLSWAKSSSFYYILKCLAFLTETSKHSYKTGMSWEVKNSHTERRLLLLGPTVVRSISLASSFGPSISVWRQEIWPPRRGNTSFSPQLGAHLEVWCRKKNTIDFSLNILGVHRPLKPPTAQACDFQQPWRTWTCWGSSLSP